MSGTGTSTTFDTRPSPTDHDVLDVVDQVRPLVGHGVQLAGRRVVLRMGAEPVRQGATEGVDAQRVELVAQLDRGCARFDHRPCRAGEPTDVRVRARPVGRCDVAVAVPLGTAASQAYAVDHAGAQEPVVRRNVGVLAGVGPVAQPPALEVRRDRPGDRQIERRDLLGTGA